MQGGGGAGRGQMAFEERKQLQVVRVGLVCGGDRWPLRRGIGWRGEGQMASTPTRGGSLACLPGTYICLPAYTYFCLSLAACISLPACLHLPWPRASACLPAPSLAACISLPAGLHLPWPQASACRPACTFPGCIHQPAPSLAACISLPACNFRGRKHQPACLHLPWPHASACLPA